MKRTVHRMEVRPFRGLEAAEVVVWEGHGGLRFKGLLASWGGEISVTDRRVIFKRATWEFARQNVKGVEVEPPPGSFTRYVLGSLAWVIDSILFWVEDPRRWPTSVDVVLLDGREAVIGFGSREEALEFAAAVRG